MQFSIWQKDKNLRELILEKKRNGKASQTVNQRFFP